MLVFAHHKGVLDALETAVKRMRVGEDGHTQQVPPNITYDFINSSMVTKTIRKDACKYCAQQHGCSCGNS